MATNKYQERMERVSESFRILRIKVGNEDAKLLALPRELRDQIWAYVVKEPDLLRRRHHPDCNRDPPFVPYESIPAVEVEYFDQRLRAYRPSATAADAPPCKKLCVRRHAMGLLRVNKMASREALKIFYESNTFCFTYREQLMAVIQSMSETTRSRIRSLALIEMPNMISRRSYLHDEMVELLATLPNLCQLEAPPVYFASARKLTDLFPRTLERITLSSLQARSYKFGGENYHVVLVVSKPFDVEKDSDQLFKYANDNHPEYRRNNNGVWTFGTSLGDAVLRTRPTHCVEPPYPDVITLPDGTEQQCLVLGLPRDTPAKRRRKRMKSIASDIAARKAEFRQARNPARAMRGVSRDEEESEGGDEEEEEKDEADDDFIPHSSAARRRPPVDDRVDHRAVLEERREMRGAQAKQAEHDRKRAVKKAVKKGQRELDAEKKASKRRVRRKG